MARFKGCVLTVYVVELFQWLFRTRSRRRKRTKHWL